VKGDFESELGALQVCMMADVLVVLVLFLAFASTYIFSKVHNMLVLMLDLHFKSFNVMKSFVGQEKVI
jgi:hypothetical protein